jgi:uncharacterized protein YwqG
MGYLAAFSRGFSAALGSFFGCVFLWAVVEAAAHRHLQPASARAAAFVAIAAVSLGVGIAAAGRGKGLQRRQAASGPAQKRTPVPQAASLDAAAKPDLDRTRQAAEQVRAALAALQQANPSMTVLLASGEPFGTAPALPVATKAAGDAASAVTETVTVVLRRQIPLRFGEAPRSWLGGLPMLPDAVGWPRSVSSEHPERGERPLHFVAQICCADLPSELWGGLGPRHGWLLLFIDPNQGVPEEADAFRVLHTETLGRERPPPPDLGPVHDGVYTAWDFGHCGGDALVPRLWRRWPVDVVAMPNEASIEERGVRVAPPDLAERLYERAPVADSGLRLPHPRPFTRRGALYALNTALHGLGTPREPPPLPQQLIVNLQAPGGLGQVRLYLEAQRDKMREKLAEPQEAEEAPAVSGPRTAALELEIANREALLAFLAAHATPAVLIAYFQDAQVKWNDWRAACRSRLKRLRDGLQDSALDVAFTEAEWTALRAEAAGEPYRGFTYHIWGDRSKNPEDTMPPIGLFHAEQHLTLEPGRGSLELVADYYVDPARQALIPPPLLADFEASWRRLRSNRPHRMGGYQDGVQSTAVIGPAELLLLFQIASDDAMHWVWGDVGAYYIYIRPADLQRNDFARASIVLECH